MLKNFYDGMADFGSLRIERTGIVNKTFYLSEDFITTSIVFRDNPNLWFLEISGYDAEVTGDIVVTGSSRAQTSIWGLEKIGSLELRDISSLYASSAIVNITRGDLVVENVDVGYSLDDLEAVAGNLRLFNTTAETHEYGHDNVINLNALSEVGGKLQIYNDWRHTSVFMTVANGFGIQADVGSVDIAGLIHE